MIPYLLIGGFFIAAAIVLHRLNKAPVDVTVGIEAVTMSSVAREYEWLLDRIQTASTKSELAALQVQVYDFEEEHKGHAWVGEMFMDLLGEINLREHVLYAHSLQTKTNS